MFWFCIPNRLIQRAKKKEKEKNEKKKEKRKKKRALGYVVLASRTRI